MQTQTIDLISSAPGTRQFLHVQRYGTRKLGPKVYIQGALHADEVPAILVAQHLARLLQTLEAQGELRGEVVLVPFANPIGLAQQHLGQHMGRFDMRDGINFNRGYSDLVPQVLQAVRPLLGGDARSNTAHIRAALCQAAQALQASSATEDLKNKLLQLAIDADIVLDLHCDADAVMHVYALTPQAPIAQQLGAALGAQAVLLAVDSGDSPFDEACTRPWLALQQALPEFPIELACFGATVELRGEADTEYTLAEQDARGLCAFLAARGVLAGPTALPPAQCEPTPLSGSEPVVAPHAGVVVFRRAPGERVAAGDCIADLVDPVTGEVTALRCRSAGVLYARSAQRWAHPGKRLAKIAGTELVRTGKLLSH